MRSAVLLAAVLVLVVPAAPLAAPPSAAQTPFDSTVTIDVHLRASGDARVNVSTAYPLNDSADRAAFDRVATDFSDGRVGFQADDFRSVADRASEMTGRSMEITDVERRAFVRNGSGNATGVLALEFTWTNFGERSGNRILVGDVFATGWLDHLGPDTRLRIHSPPQYGVQDAPVPIRSGKLVWTGPHTFEDGGPEVVYEGGLDTSTVTNTTTTPGPGEVFDGEFQMVLAVLAVLLVGGLLAYVWTRREDELPDGDGAGGAATGEATGAGGEQAAEEATTGDGTTTDESPDEVRGGAAEDGADEATTDESDVDEELLSDEERVERMLRRNGGRMKQANIVKETGWSNAKVSQLLSGMAEDDRVEKLRIGRENLIILPDEDEGGDDPF